MAEDRYSQRVNRQLAKYSAVYHNIIDNYAWSSQQEKIDFGKRFDPEKFEYMRETHASPLRKILRRFNVKTARQRRYFEKKVAEAENLKRKTWLLLQIGDALLNRRNA